MRPAGKGWHTFDTAVLEARPILSPTPVATATLKTKTPAPVLLIDDDRWYNVENHYKNALDENGIPYDYWEVNDGWPWESPSLEILRRYPMLVWYTAYDWGETLADEEEGRLSNYLEGGGRLFFSGQDYLYDRGGVTAFALKAYTFVPFYKTYLPAILRGYPPPTPPPPPTPCIKSISQ
ncbi:MAG: hypothetical protein ACUVV0_04925 [Anaerolineae bacterium]